MKKTYIICLALFIVTGIVYFYWPRLFARPKCVETYALIERALVSYVYIPEERREALHNVMVLSEKELHAKPTNENFFYNVIPAIISAVSTSHFSILISNDTTGDRKIFGRYLDVSYPVASCAGIVLSSRADAVPIRVLRVEKGSPFDRIGIRAGWEVSSIELNRANKTLILQFDNFFGANRVVNLEVRSKEQDIITHRIDKFGIVSLGLRKFLEEKGLSIENGNSTQTPSIVFIPPNNPAYAAGLREGQEILGFDLISQPHGKREIKIYTRERQKNPILLNCVNNNLSERKIRFFGNIVYLKFDNFDNSVMQWLKESTNNKDKRYIIDIRNNTGGPIENMINILGYIVGSDKYLGKTIRSGRSDDLYTPSTEENGLSYKFVILTSKATASSAEIFADVSRFYNKAVLIGSRTAGEVMISQSMDMSRDLQITIPIAGYRDPAGKSIEGIGVSPDFYPGANDGTSDNSIDMAIAYFRN